MGRIEKTLAGLPPRTRRLVVALVGSLVVLIGVVMIPYPGPGWLVVFMGFAILSQEFVWARRALEYGKAKYDYWTKWVVAQHPALKVVLFMITTIVVVLTIWLLNGYGLLNAWFRLDQDWLNSPLVN
jgi:uncharacterized protein (TIGR02611 family)